VTDVANVRPEARRRLTPQREKRKRHDLNLVPLSR
jgi:hypothetical protein